MTTEEWEVCIRPKVHASWNLHLALPQQMDFFVMLSSACGICGNPGQSNYAAGNTYQDALAGYLTRRGQRAYAIDLGLVEAEGFVAENRSIRDNLLRRGILRPITLEQMFAILDHCCNAELPLPSPAQSQIVTGIELPAHVAAKGLEIPFFMREPLYKQLHQVRTKQNHRTSAGDATGEMLNYRKMLIEKSQSSEGTEEAGGIIAEALRRKLCRILGLSVNEIEISHQIDSFGVDSLVALELRNWLSKEIQADIAVFELLGGATFERVGKIAATRTELLRN
jgi:hypothetical protein